MRRSAGVLATALAVVLPPPGPADPVAGRLRERARMDAGLQDWLVGFRVRAVAQGIDAATLERGFRGVRYLPEVIASDRNQAEFARTIWDYLDAAVSAQRLAEGQAALAQHADLLVRIAAAYGVEPAVVVAIWGMESSYGAHRGDLPVISALATLAHDGRRAAFFEAELLAALRILAAGDVEPAAMRGSWAGAMGHTQFMPTSYLATAVDFTGDGRRDIWGPDPSDALASTAAYLAQAGWVAGQVWGYEVALPAGFDPLLSGKGQRRAVAEWQALGLRRVGGGDLRGDGAASVLLPAGARGAAFLILPNFHAIAAYNAADAYVIGVGHLADRLQGGPAIQTAWPRGERALLRAERIELQQRLTAAGFATGGVDGMIGPKTIAAILAYQQACGLAADGYPGPDLLGRLR